MGAKTRSNTLPLIFLADLSNVYRNFVSLIYAISTLLFLVARKASGENELKLNNYFSSIVAQLLKLSTICKSPGHARSYVDRKWERSANYSARTFLLFIISTQTTVSQILVNSPAIFHFVIPKNKPTQSATIDLTLWVHRTEDEPKLKFSAITSKKVRAP